MKTENDLRLEFKRETGLYAFSSDLKDEITDAYYELETCKLGDVVERMEDLRSAIDDVDTLLSEDVYMKWLEEKLIERWT